MAQTIRTVLVDDITEEELPEGAGETVKFGLDGKEYEIDLSDANAAALRAIFEKYEAVGRRVGGRKIPPKGGAKLSVVQPGTSVRSMDSRESAANVRTWALSSEGSQMLKEKGIPIPGDRGRFPAGVLEAYRSRDDKTPLAHLTAVKAVEKPESTPEPVVFQEAATEPQETAQEAPKPAPRKRAAKKASVIPQ